MLYSKLESLIWSNPKPDVALSFVSINYQMIQSNVIEPKTRCCTLMCVNQWLNDISWCGTPLFSENWQCSLLIYSDISRSKSFQFLTCQQISKDLKAFTHYLSFRLVCLDSDKTRRLHLILHFFVWKGNFLLRGTIYSMTLKI